MHPSTIVRSLVFALAVSWQATRAIAGPDPPASTSPTAASPWKLERVTLRDGKVYEGLVQAERPTTIDFVEVRRPSGKPLFLVVRSIARDKIASWERLALADLDDLRSRLEKHKQRALIEGRQMEDLTIEPSQVDGRTVWRYQGPWFALSSTADEQMTRRVIVRLDQLFTAYRQLLPPRLAAPARVEVRVFGTRDEYRAALTELDLSIQNPAVFLAEGNLILAGSDLNHFSAELAHVSREHRRIRERFDDDMDAAPARLKQLGDDLKNNGVSTAERLRIVVAEQRKWDDQRKAVHRKIAAIDRKNSARFNEVAGMMFIRLAHEAFHAYLETQVYPRAEHDVPRWLNEGLAQTFEAGLLEAGSLRVDTPHLTALRLLQADLRGSAPFELSELFGARAETFLAAHSGGPAISRQYAYSWGLAYYLAFDQGIVGSPRLEEYLGPSAAGHPPRERFERLVGMPLDEFQAEWREAMLNLKAGP